MTNKETVVYFRNITSLRFFAALLVFCSHFEYMKKEAGLSNYYYWGFFREAGHLGVVCFFVLSGFLITYLLLQEQKVFKKIHIKTFYLRRILRIWPLYFLVIIVGFFILPLVPLGQEPINNKWENLALSILFLPNLASILYSAVPFIGQIWSIGVEEQFYLFWPWLMKSGRLKKTIFIFLISFWAVKFILVVLSHFYTSPFIQLPLSFIHISSFDSLLLGGLGAWLVFQKNERILPLIFNKGFQFGFYILAFGLIATGFYFPYIHTQVYSLIFLVLILNLAANPNSILRMESPLLIYLGKISYGIYMFHLVAIVMGIQLRELVSLKPGLADLIFSLILTILCSIISYELLEKKFLQLKNRLELIRTSGADTGV